MTPAIQASPIASIGDVISYIDHHKRAQEGEVLRIEANWADWARAGSATVPFITYTVSHPTYRRNRCHVGERDIVEVTA